MPEYTRPATSDDVLPAAGGMSWDALKPHVATVDIEGTPLRVLDLEGLLETKRGARPRDALDAQWIERALELLKRR